MGKEYFLGVLSVTAPHISSYFQSSTHLSFVLHGLPPPLPSPPHTPSLTVLPPPLPPLPNCLPLPQFPFPHCLPLFCLPSPTASPPPLPPLSHCLQCPPHTPPPPPPQLTPHPCLGWLASSSREQPRDGLSRSVLDTWLWALPLPAVPPQTGTGPL